MQWARILAYTTGTVDQELLLRNEFVVEILCVSLIRELGPVLAAILIAGRSGSAITAQIGAMCVRATLIEAKGGADRSVAQQVFVMQRPAANADAPGGVRALTAATDAAVEEIGVWLQQQPAR